MEEELQEKRSYSRLWGDGRRRNVRSSGTFDPETLVQQKREWQRQNEAVREQLEAQSPATGLFEHFVIVGLSPSTDCSKFVAEPVPEVTPKTTTKHEYSGPSTETGVPELLFKFPPGKPLPVPELPDFCFPHGIQARKVPRTPSMSHLHEIIYGQAHKHSDEHSFIFMLKVADNIPLYCVCVYVEELVGTPPGIVSSVSSGISGQSREYTPLERYEYASPRCYCLVSFLPFFRLHFDVLYDVLAQDRLDRITLSVNALDVAAGLSRPMPTLPQPQMSTGSDVPEPETPRAEPEPGAEAEQPLDEQEDVSQSVAELSLSGDEDQEFYDTTDKAQEDGAHSPTADAGNGCYEMAEVDEDCERGKCDAQQDPDESASAGSLSGNEEVSSQPCGTITKAMKRVSFAGCENHEGESNGASSSEYLSDIPNMVEQNKGPSEAVSNGAQADTAERTADALDPSDKAPALGIRASEPADEEHAENSHDDHVATQLERLAVAPDSERSLTDLEDSGTIELSLSSPIFGEGHHKRTSSSSAFSLTDEPVQGEGFDEEEAKSLIDWARENCCDALKIIIEYHRCRIPRLGETLHFASLTHLDDLLYTREEWETTIPVDSMKKLTHKRSLPGEEAHVLQDWCIATICRVMSLENILSLLLNTVLEKQIVLLCPKLGVLTTVCMAIPAMIQPFQWQSVMLPVLPEELLTVLDAPVPFVVGVQYKTDEVREKSHGLMRVNIYKDKVTVPQSIARLPKHRQLSAKLLPHYQKLAGPLSQDGRKACHQCPPATSKVAAAFAGELKEYFRSLVVDVPKYTITDVGTKGEKVSLLLKDDFVNSFTLRERQFMKAFCETQMFSVYTDMLLKEWDSR
mmetsp:Transcript_8723/g.32176  ORF Transcript_8723/g.32176 Transcript_8723/m.32176 type:complete len:857 (+) Transcript_8723:222-2792(+)